MEQQEQQQPPTLQKSATNGGTNHTSPGKESIESQIVKQMEYYFSDENLPKDKFLRKQMAQDVSGQGFVSLELLASFPKIKRLSSDVNFIRETLKNQSTSLILSEDGTLVRRKVPIDLQAFEEELARRTICVHNLPKELSATTLVHTLSIFGKVRHVEVQRKRKNAADSKKVFVEFESETNAQRALSEFASKCIELAAAGVLVSPRTVKHHNTAKKEATGKEKSESKKSRKEKKDKTNEPKPNNANEPKKKKTQEKKENEKKEQITETPTAPQVSIYEAEPQFNYSKSRQRRSSSASSQQVVKEWEPDPNSASKRPTLILKSAKTEEHPTIIPSRQPIGPTPNAKGFTLKRQVQLIQTPV